MNPVIPATAGFSDKIASGILTGLKKIPYIKNKVSTPKGEKVTKKVINIAIELFKAAGIVAVGASFGALVGVSFGGPIPIVISSVVGGLSAGIAFFGTKAVIAVITKFAYPSTRYRKEKAISLEQWLTDSKLPEFTQTLDTFKKEEWFKSWLALKDYSKCNNFLWRRFQKGFCYGESQNLLELVKRSPKTDSQTLLSNLSAKNIFRSQSLEIIRADFASILKKNKHSTIRGLKRKKLKKQLAFLTKQADYVLAVKKYPPCHFDKNKLLNYSKFKIHFTDYAKQLQVKNKNLAGTIRIEGRHKAHTIFIQYQKGHYRIYDGYSPRHTGFYEFPNRTAFLKGLHRHLRIYAKVPSLTGKTYKKASIQLSGI